MSLPPSLRNQFELLETLPKGKIFDCYRVKDHRRGGIDAVLRLVPNKLTQQIDFVEHFHNFFERFNGISNRKYIPSVYSVVGGNNHNLYILEEYFHGVSLDRFVEINRGSHTFFTDVTEILWRVSEGLHHSHQKGVFHLCILPQDILIDPNDASKIKLVGFGSQILASLGYIKYLSIHDTKYLAPELLSLGDVSPQSDVYCLAQITVEMLAKSEPLPDEISRSTLANPAIRASSVRTFGAMLRNLQNDMQKTEQNDPKGPDSPTSTGGLKPMLRLTTDPTGVTVLVDGKFLGTTTNSGLSLPWNKGKIVCFEKPGYETRKISLNFPVDETTLNVKLDPALKLFTTPWGVKVSLDGREIGLTTHKGFAIPWRQGEIVLSKDGYESHTLSQDNLPTHNEICVELFPIRLELQRQPQAEVKPPSRARIVETGDPHSVRHDPVLRKTPPNRVQPKNGERNVKTESRNVSKRDFDLIEAARRGDLKTVQQQLSSGMDPDSTNEKGYTALMMAASRGHSDVVALLLAYGASRHLRSCVGYSALDFARFWKDRETISLLSDCLSKVDGSLLGHKTKK